MTRRGPKLRGKQTRVRITWRFEPDLLERCRKFGNLTEFVETAILQRLARLEGLKKMTETKRLPVVRSLAGVPLKDPKRKGPPLGTFMPGAKYSGRRGALASPWRKMTLTAKSRENAARSGFRDGQ